jgi:hypothetical protein
MSVVARCSALLLAAGVSACAQIAGVSDLSFCSRDCDAVEGGSSGGGGDLEAQASDSPPATVEGDDGASAGPGDDARIALEDAMVTADATESEAPEGPDTGTAHRDAAPEAEAEAGRGMDAGDATSSCGPTNTTSNCGACGSACEAAHSTPSACTADKCTYSACASGWSDCDKAGADTNGCECHTPACCPGGACQSAHASGAGQTFYDCVAPGTFSLTQAMGACAAFTGNSTQCVDAPAGICGTSRSVCSPGASQCWCWQYAGTYAGTVEHQAGPICPSGCPMGGGAAWN